jgi:hypothetical protein
VSRPFFTIAIPSKNRPDRVRDALRSLVEQTFADVEIVVCDNSDEQEADQTAAVVGKFDDLRVRYVRTNGRLSMPDNWERAIEDAGGEYVGILTDRSVLRRDALEVAHREIDATGAQVVNWFNDLYGRDSSGRQYKRRPCTFKRYQHSPETIIDYFLRGHPKYSNKVIPKLMTSVCHRSILQAMRDSPIGRCCPPVAPDFTSGFQMLAHCEWILTLDESMYVSSGTGNGASFRRGGELADRFRRDLGMEAHEMVDLMPSRASFAHALVRNDFVRVRNVLPDCFPDAEIDRTQYYLGCLTDYVKAARQGARRDDNLVALLDALELEPAEIKEPVQQTELFTRATRPEGVPEKVKKNAVAATLFPEFDTVFDAMAWDEANPREPTATEVLALNRGVEELFVKKSRVRPAHKASAHVAAPPERSRGTLGTRLRTLLALGRTLR